MLAVLAPIRKLAYSKKKFPLPPAPLSCVCQGRGDCQQWEGDALADSVQLELLVPWLGQGDTVVRSVVFPAWLVLLAKGRFAHWCVFTAGLSARVSPFTPGQRRARSFPLVLGPFSPCISSRGADLIREDFPEDGTCLPGSKQPEEFVPRGPTVVGLGSL